MQSNPETSTISLTFHNYEETIINSSIYSYSGVDGCPPQVLNAYSISVECLTPGSFSGFSFYMGYVAWTLAEPIQKDLHVVGEIKMTVWMSSTDDLGFLQGSGFGMGLTDIDEDGNMVEIFELVDEEGNVGGRGLGNVFSPTPTPYTMILDIEDYVFEKGHTIAFGVGFGSNKQGFSVNVFFDSPDNNSGATLQVKDLIDQNEFDVVWEPKSYPVIVESNSSINNFEFSQTEKQITFDVSDVLCSNGFSYCMIPKVILEGPFTVFVDSQQITDTTSENTTHSFIYFTYSQGFHTIKIVGTTTIEGEYPRIVITPTSWTETLSPNECKTKIFTIENVGSADLNVFNILESVSWLTITSNPAPVTIDPGRSTLFNVNMCSDETTVKNTVITIVSDDPTNTNYEIPITMNVSSKDTHTLTANAGLDQIVNIGVSVIFNATDSSDNINIVSYEWDFGDSDTGTGLTTSHIYTNPGTYNVTLKVTNTEGNSDKDSVTIIVLEDIDENGPPPDLTDIDNDNIPDTWEVENGLNPLNATDAAIDNDSDGLTSIQEYQMGTDPNNYFSPFPWWILGVVVIIGVALTLVVFFLKLK